MENNEQLLYLNGLDATTGDPLIEPVRYRELTKWVLDNYAPEQSRQEKRIYTQERRWEENELDDPAQVGWGLLVHADEAEEMKERLTLLIERRAGQVFIYNGESVYDWKRKYHADHIDFKQFPYYVLIAGSPTKIPYDLQFSLAVLRAVGRIDFDESKDYVYYAHTVVNYERNQIQAPGKRVVFFAPRHSDDDPTSQTSEHLVGPILKDLPEVKDIPTTLTYDALIGNNATKANLLAALNAHNSEKTPAVVFSASHGAAIPATDPDQRFLQGSIICQDYKLPLTSQKRQGFISGYDVAEGFCLPGGILFTFACYGAGTRSHSDFIRYVPGTQARQKLESWQGKEDFVAYLPKSLLANPKGGTLAVIGHVDPAWVHAFTSVATGERRIESFALTLAKLLRGKPVGFALSAFNQKYADLSNDLLNLVEDMEELGIDPDPKNFTDLWICRNDAQNYVIIGDPAVCLSLGAKK
ncbi:MAG: hypothetical protein AB4426_07555 [Xenococcaceae cyanobacterium]